MLKEVKTIPSAPSHQVSAPGFYARHNGTAVIAEGEITGTINSQSKLVAADTLEEVRAECEKLKLTPMPKTNSQKAIDIFMSTPEAVQAQFGPAFQAISALSSDSEKTKAISAVTVPPELQGLKDSLLGVFA